MFTVSVASVGREVSGQICHIQAALQQAVQTSCSGQQADGGPTQPGKRVLSPAHLLLGICSACAAARAFSLLPLIPLRHHQISRASAVIKDHHRPS